MNNSFRIIWVCVSLCFAFSISAESVFNKFKKYTSINSDWSQLSKEEYVNNLVACELKIQEYKWSKSIWPEVNKTPKPPFNEVVKVNEVRQQVLDTLYKQNILSIQFNIDINHAMLQHDIDRMARNSKDPKGLKSLFVLMDNNPAIITQCVSRPYLVHTKTQNSYNYNGLIHQEIKALAEQEREVYLKNNRADNLTAQVSIVTYKLKSKDKDIEREAQLPNDGVIIELEKQEFLEKVSLFASDELQEHPTAFVYSEVLEKAQFNIKVKTLIWKKQSLKKWLDTQEQAIKMPSFQNTQFSLPEITGSSNTYSTKSGQILGDSWKQQAYFPEGRYSHTAVWTGSEMIVWGGKAENYLRSGGRYNPDTDSWIATSTSGAPSSRGQHIAIWTGIEMLVWGGNDGGNLNTGGRYNPNSDSWVSINTNGAPSARRDFTAVWSGNEMIIWGGLDINYFDTGGRYNPNNDSWISINSNDAPTGRSDHSAVWSGTEMIIWGGTRGGSLNSGGRYNPDNDSWALTSTSGAPSARRQHTAVWSGSEMIVWGGIGSNFLNSGGRYNPINDSWVAISTSGVPSRRAEHTAVWDESEMIVWAGYDNNRLNTGGRYNPSNDTWNITNSNGASSARRQHTAVWSGSEMIIWGGTGNGGTYLNTGARYNPVNDNWAITSDNTTVPSGRAFHTSVWSGNEMIIWGGYNNSYYLGNGGKYNPSSDSWIATSSGSESRGRHTAVWTGMEMIIWGGDAFNNLDTGARYNPLSDSWVNTNRSGAPLARFYHTAVWSGTEMIIWGGLRTGGAYLGGGSHYNPVTDSWTLISNGGPGGRYDHTAVWTNNEMIVWGGFDGLNYFNTGGRYNPEDNSWATMSISGAPIARTRHTAVWTGNEMMIWGGKNVSSLNSGRRYNPVNDEWTAISTIGAATGRHNHTAVWTGTEMIVWGGLSGVTVGNGSRYNPISDSWLSTSNNGAPSARSLHTAVWTENEMIVWGGHKDINTMGVYYPYGYYSIGGELTGLIGNQIVLQNNTGDDLTLTTNGTFEFDIALSQGASYEVSVLTEPQSPGQNCTVTNGTGTNINANITDVQVTCISNTFDVGVTVSGLASGNSIEFENNGGNSLMVSVNDVKQNFTMPVDDGSNYLVTITTQPAEPNQTCVINSGEETGTINGADVNVEVTCTTNQYNVGVDISGLALNNSLTLQNNGGDDLIVSANGNRVFATVLNDGSSYEVTVLSNPTEPNQTCVVTGGDNSDGTGTLSGGNETSVNVTCSTNQYSIGGLVSGLEPGNNVVLQNNASDDLIISSDGPFTFSTILDDESVYSVSVLTQPTTPNQLCTITNETGNLGGENITDILVNCVTDEFTLGGSVSGLANGNLITLSNNAGDEYLVVDSNSSFVFMKALKDGFTYEITIASNPTFPNQTCSVNKGSGTIMGTHVTDVEVICEIDQYFVGGYVLGLIPDNHMVLQNNDADDLTLSHEGAFVFATPLDYQQSYAVTIQKQPDNPIQSCDLINTSGSISGQDISNIFMYCEFGDDLIFRHGFDDSEGISRILWEQENLISE